MKELINELRLDAGISRIHDEPYLVVINKSGEIIDPLIGLKKFAELIVRECIEVVDNRSKKDFHPTSFGGELLHYVTTDLKEHFGVEE